MSHFFSIFSKNPNFLIKYPNPNPKWFYKIGEIYFSLYYISQCFFMCQITMCLLMYILASWCDPEA